MAEGMRVSFEVTGLGSVLAQLREISDPRKLEKTTRESLGRSSVKVIAPRLAKKGGWRYGGHGGRYPTKGLLGERRRITARKVRLRSGEFVAISIRPRGWAGTVSAWAVKGTKPHVIEARGPGGMRASSSRVRSINRQESGTAYLGRRQRSSGALTRTGRALLINGFYRERVRHPGARPTDYIHDAVTPDLERAVVHQLEVDIFAAVERAKRAAGGTK